VKLAAMEGQFATQTRAPLRIGGIPDEGAEVTRGAIEVPGALSWLAYGDADARVMGLADVPRDLRPSVAIVHLAFQAMVGAGTALFALAAWMLVRIVRTRPLAESKWMLRCVVVAGPASVVALIAGWIVTEVGRQPWIVQGVMRTKDAVTSSGGVVPILVITLTIYAVLLSAMTGVLRHLAKKPLAEDPHGV
jgi:cytochrome d ubiquinol oxidase subunit I